MHGGSPGQIELARRLLAHEALAAGKDAGAASAGRVYDKLVAHLSPLIGVAGAELLFVRSAKLTSGELDDLARLPVFERSIKLRERLHAQDPAVADDLAAALFAGLFALLTNFIGERLTSQVLRSAWPAIETTSRETK